MAILSPDQLENLKRVIYRITEEGIDYAFIGYSDFEEFEDEEFHRRRLAYIDAVKSMTTYLTDLAAENGFDAKEEYGLR